MAKKKEVGCKYLSKEEAEEINTLDLEVLLKELPFQNQKIIDVEKAKKDDLDLQRVKNDLKEINEEYKESIGKLTEKVQLMIKRIGTLKKEK